jgi:hypothetical protein
VLDEVSDKRPVQSGHGAREDESVADDAGDEEKGAVIVNGKSQKYSFPRNHCCVCLFMPVAEYAGTAP